MPIKDKKFNAISQYNTRYRLERWQTPQGGTLIGQLPGSVKGFMRFCLFLWAISGLARFGASGVAASSLAFQSSAL
jgi:hypothetical protein